MNDSQLQFEWDEAKARANVVKHGVSFLAAAEIFSSEILGRSDDREDYGEARFIALGRSGVEVLRVSYTWRGDNTVRLISAQKASRHEREIYFSQIRPQ